MLTNNLVDVNLEQLEKIYILAKRSIDAVIVLLDNKGIKNEVSVEDLSKFSASADNLIKNKLQSKFY